MFRLFGIVRQDVNTEIMLAIHPGVHHELKLDGSLFAWLEGRRTDDSFGWSTPLAHFHARFALEGQRSIADILDVKYGFDGGA